MIDYGFHHNVTITVGGKDLTSCFKGLSLGQPLHEPESLLIWSGQLTLSLTVAAQQSGISAADLDPIATPGRWATGVSQVVITIGNGSGPTGDGVTILKMRIKDWRYDYQELTGQGSLAQQIDLNNQSFPEFSPDLVYVTPGHPTSHNVIIDRLLKGVALKSTVPFLRDTTPASPYYLWGAKATRQPLGNVQELLKTEWSWLQQRLNDEHCSVISTNYKEPVLFARDRTKASVVPNLNNLHFAAPKVIAHGSCDVPDLCDLTNRSPNVDDHGNLRYEDVEEKEPYNQVLKNAKGAGVSYTYDKTNVTPIVTTKRRVEYEYSYNQYRTSSATSGETLLDFDLPSFPSISRGKSFDDKGLTRKTIDTYQLWAKIRPGNADFAPHSFIRSSYEVETFDFKAKWEYRKTVVKNSAGSVIYSRDGLTLVSFTPMGDAARDKHACLDVAAPEQPGPIAQKLKQAMSKAQTSVTQGYTPALNYPLVYNMGYCPSQKSAKLVSERLAFREVARKFADDVTLPLPLEWLQSGCPVFSRCQIGNKVYWLDGAAFEVAVDEQGRQQAGLKFTGLITGTTTPIAPATYGTYDPALTSDLTSSWPSSLTTSQGIALTYHL